MSDEEARTLAEELRRSDPRIEPDRWVASARAIRDGRVRTAKEVRAERKKQRRGKPTD